MKGKHLAVSLMATGALAAGVVGCGSMSSSAGRRSAVSGRVFSHGCPAQHPGHLCGGWFNGTLRFARLVCPTPGTCTPGALVASVHSDRRGRFRVMLAPGRYMIIAVGLENSPTGQSFSVSAGRPVSMSVSIRNGIE